MSYYTNKNPRNIHGGIRYAVIHKAECHECQHGHGKKNRYPQFWHGPFTTYAQAISVAQQDASAPEWGDPWPCAKCKPNITV
jgi:hypothetical protein